MGLRHHHLILLLTGLAIGLAPATPAPAETAPQSDGGESASTTATTPRRERGPIVYDATWTRHTVDTTPSYQAPAESGQRGLFDRSTDRGRTDLTAPPTPAPADLMRPRPVSPSEDEEDENWIKPTLRSDAMRAISEENEKDKSGWGWLADSISQQAAARAEAAAVQEEERTRTEEENAALLARETESTEPGALGSNDPFNNPPTVLIDPLDNGPAQELRPAATALGRRADPADGEFNAWAREEDLARTSWNQPSDLRDNQPLRVSNDWAPDLTPSLSTPSTRISSRVDNPLTTSGSSQGTTMSATRYDQRTIATPATSFGSAGGDNSSASSWNSQADRSFDQESWGGGWSSSSTISQSAPSDTRSSASSQPADLLSPRLRSMRNNNFTTDW
jgi:hypothetical protein